MAITDSSRASPPAQGPSTTPLPPLVFAKAPKVSINSHSFRLLLSHHIAMMVRQSHETALHILCCNPKEGVNGW